MILTMTSCKKSLIDILNEESDQYYHIPTDLLKIGDFKKGSYWTYHNDSLNINKTVAVINYTKTEELERIDNFHVHYDKIIITLSSNYKDSIISDVFTCYTGGGVYTRTNIIKKNENYINADIYLTSGFASNYAYIEYYNKYNFNGYTIDIVTGYTDFKTHCKYYFADNIGIIKMTSNENGKVLEWNLTKYKIVK